MGDAEVKAFRLLNKPCAELSQVSLKQKAGQASSKDVVKSLETVHERLEGVLKIPNALNPKLSDYVFFPLAQIFRRFKELPTRATEVAVLCLQILVKNGWKEDIPTEMVKQLLILLCFIVGGSSTESNVKLMQEDLGRAIFDCLTLLFQACENAGLAEGGGIKAENASIFGHTVVVILDGVAAGGSPEVKISALRALDQLVLTISDLAALKTVFPGVVSTLAKVLGSKVSSRPSSKTLVMAMHVLNVMLSKVMSDEATSSRLPDPSTKTSVSESRPDQPKSWLEGTASQVKMALANVMALRQSDSSEVRRSLLLLCQTVLQKCQQSLHQSVPMAVENLVVLGSSLGPYDHQVNLSIKETIRNDALTMETLKASVNDWLISFPRALQSNDDRKINDTISRISQAFTILQSDDSSLAFLGKSLFASLRGGIVELLQSRSRDLLITPVSSPGREVRQILQSNNKIHAADGFEPILLNAAKNSGILSSLSQFFARLAASPIIINLQQDVVNMLGSSDATEQLASLWLSLQLVKVKSTESKNVHDGLDRNRKGGLLVDPFIEEIYPFALEVLSRSTFDDEDRWKLQALSLETVAFQALRHGHEFRPELVDALYPVLERLGSNNQILQKHAITCLSMVSKACEYQSPAALVVDNADYLVNAISLKMNTFSISPQAPQVLVMIVRLCGAPLVPYLDDVIESIFSILACYHGYPKLTESMFSALSAIADEAGKSTSKTIEYSHDGISKARHHHPATLTEVSLLLQRDSSPLPRTPSPDPLPTLSQTHITNDKDGEDENNSSIEPSSPTSEGPETELDPKPPKSKTLTLLQHIATATEPHLTTPSPSLQINLLHLLRDSFAPLAASDANTFLPLSAGVFPLLSTRMFASSTGGEDGQQQQPAVILAAVEAMTTLCESSGDFLSSRVAEHGWWGKLMRLWRRAEEGKREEERVWSGNSHRKGTSTSVAARPRAVAATARPQRGSTVGVVGFGGSGIWTRVSSALLSLLLAIASDVGLDGTKEDQVFEMLGPLAVLTDDDDNDNESEGVGGRKGAGDRDGKVAEIRKVLELVNADALWLVDQLAIAKTEKVKEEKGSVMRRPGTTAGGSDGEGKWGFVDIRF